MYRKNVDDIDLIDVISNRIGTTDIKVDDKFYNRRVGIGYEYTEREEFREAKKKIFKKRKESRRMEESDEFELKRIK